QIKKSFQNIDEKVNSIEEIYKPFTQLSNYVYNKVATPLQNTSRVISGIYKALEVFIGVLSKKGERKNGY
ncbi:MAG: hypothetical protein ACK42G_06845, partial [Candidatus Kapaibacteriota bacterium]